MAKSPASPSRALAPINSLPAHDDYGGSGAYRWLNCALAVPLAKTLPSRPAGAAAERGTALHAAMELLTADSSMKPEKFIGARAANGVIIEAEGVAALKIALADVQALQKLYPTKKYIWNFEARIRYEEDCGGSSDILIYSDDIMIIADYKFGEVLVDVAENEQFMLYALAARKQMVLRPKIIHMYVIQPTFDPSMVHYTATAAELDTFEARTRLALKASRGPNPQPTPGDWCGWCAGKLTCPAKTQALATLTRKDVHALDLDKLGEQALIARDLAKWGEEAEARIFHELENGVAVAGWKLVAKQAKRSWVNEGAALAALKKIMPKAANALLELISPAQVEKLGGAAVKAVVAKHTQAISSGLRAAPATDKAPAAFNPKMLDKAQQAIK